MPLGCLDRGPYPCSEAGCPKALLSCANMARRALCHLRFADVWQGPPPSEGYIWRQCPRACGRCDGLTNRSARAAALRERSVPELLELISRVNKRARTTSWQAAPPRGGRVLRDAGARPLSSRGEETDLPRPTCVPLDAPAAGHESTNRTCFEQVSAAPRIYWFPRFLSDAEIEHYRAITHSSPGRGEGGDRRARRSRAPGAPVDENSRAEDPRERDLRSRRFTNVSEAVRDPFVAAILRRVLAVIDYPPTHLRAALFAKATSYRAPRDYYPPHVDWRGGTAAAQYASRYATLIFYLTDVASGGETVFVNLRAADHALGTNGAVQAFKPLVSAHPRVNKWLWKGAGSAGAMSADERLRLLRSVCASPAYFKVRPQRGAAVLFFNSLDGHEEDLRVAHMGCPVLQGPPKEIGVFRESAPSAPAPSRMRPARE